MRSIKPRMPPADGQVYAVTCGHSVIVCPRTPMTNGARTSRCARTERLAGEKASSKVIGRAHRHSSGCSSLVTDGTWLGRQNLPHSVETPTSRCP